MVRSQPLVELERLIERMAAEMDTFEHSDWFSRSSVPVDVVERDDEFVVTIDLPGFERDDVTVNIVDETVHITAAHETADSVTDEQYVRRERSHESVRRSFRFPGSVDAAAASARMRNGVLTVIVPQSDELDGTIVEFEE